MFRSSTASSTSESVIFSKGLSLEVLLEVKVCGKRRREVGLVIPGHYKARTKSRSHCKISDRELNPILDRVQAYPILDGGAKKPPRVNSAI